MARPYQSYKVKFPLFKIDENHKVHRLPTLPWHKNKITYGGISVRDLYSGKRFDSVQHRETYKKITTNKRWIERTEGAREHGRQVGILNRNKKKSESNTFMCIQASTAEINRRRSKLISSYMYFPPYKAQSENKAEYLKKVKKRYKSYVKMAKVSRNNVRTIVIKKVKLRGVVHKS